MTSVSSCAHRPRALRPSTQATGRRGSTSPTLLGATTTRRFRVRNSAGPCPRKYLKPFNVNDLMTTRGPLPIADGSVGGRRLRGPAPRAATTRTGTLKDRNGDRLRVGNRRLSSTASTRARGVPCKPRGEPFDRRGRSLRTRLYCAGPLLRLRPNRRRASFAGPFPSRRHGTRPLPRPFARLSQRGTCERGADVRSPARLQKNVERLGKARPGHHPSTALTRPCASRS